MTGTHLNRTICDFVSYLINESGEFRHTAENSSMGIRRWSHGEETGCVSRPTLRHLSRSQDLNSAPGPYSQDSAR